MGAIKIEKLRFLEYGKSAPEGSRFKGVMDTKAVIGFMGYTGREEAKENEQNISQHEDGFFGYTTSKTEGTFTSLGYIENESDKKEFKQLIAKAFSKPGDILWDQVISIKTYEEAYNYGLRSGADWERVVQTVLPKIFKDMKLEKDNMVWWMDYHTDTQHPHIHLVMMEKERTRSKGKITKRQLGKLKTYFWSELGARKDLEKRVEKNYKDFFKEKDLDFQHLVKEVDTKILQRKKIPLKDLAKILPKTGRLQYNSYAMKEFQPVIDKIILDTILSSKKISNSMEQWMRKIEILETNMNDFSNEKIASIKEAEMKKLYSRVGNMILQNYRDTELIEKQVVNKKTGKTSTRTYKKRKLTNASLEHAIISTAHAQERDMEESLEEFLRRYESEIL